MRSPAHSLRPPLALLVTLGLLLPKTLLASEAQQQLYYHLHQALVVIERSTQGQCPPGSLAAQHHLVEADQALAQLLTLEPTAQTPLEPVLKSLWTASHLIGLMPMADLYDMRLALHDTGASQQLNHDEQWYQEVEHPCRE